MDELDLSREVKGWEGGYDPRAPGPAVDDDEGEEDLAYEYAGIDEEAAS